MERSKQHENPPSERIVQHKFGSKTCIERAMNAQLFGDDSAPYSQSVIGTATFTGLETKKTNRNTARELSQQFVTTKSKL